MISFPGIDRVTSFLVCVLVAVGLCTVFSSFVSGCADESPGRSRETGTTTSSVTVSPQQKQELIDANVRQARKIADALKEIKADIDENQLHLDYLDAVFGSRPVEQWSIPDQRHYDSHVTAIEALMDQAKTQIDEYNTLAAGIPTDRLQTEKLAASLNPGDFQPVPGQLNMSTTSL